MIIYILVFISGLLLGFLWGKRNGFGLGNKVGKAEMILLLRQRSLEEGCCILCSKSSETPSSCIDFEQYSHTRPEVS